MKGASKNQRTALRRHEDGRSPRFEVDEKDTPRREVMRGEGEE